MKFDQYIKMRELILPKLEVLRIEKSIGKATEAGIILRNIECPYYPHYEHVKLTCGVSECFVEGYTQNNEVILLHDIHVWSLKNDPEYSQCPRCRLFFLDKFLNYDKLCNRYCGVLLCEYPHLPVCEAIKEFHNASKHISSN